MALAAACADEPAGPPPAPPDAVGDFRLLVDGEGFRLVPAAEPDRVLLELFTGGVVPYRGVATRTAEATVEMRYGAWRFEDGPGAWTAGRELADAGGAPRTLRFADAAGETFLELVATPAGDGAVTLALQATRAGTNRLSVAFACDPGDRFLGFGAQADALDHRGHEIAIWTSEPGIGKTGSDEPGELWFLEGTRHASSAGLPTWLSGRGYLAVADVRARTTFELCSERGDAFRIETWSDRLSLTVYDGPAPRESLRRATAGLLGRPPRPPPMAFAPWNDAIFGSARVRELAALLRSRGIPSSAIWTEDFRGGQDVPGQGYRLREEWELDRTLYPDAEALAAELGAQGFAWHAYFNTFLVEGTSIYAEALAGGHLVLGPGGAPYLFSGVTFEPTGLADLSRPATREWVKGYLRRALDAGFTGWMADYGEWLPHDAVLASGEDPAAAHLRYPLEWASLNAQALAEREADGVQRTFFVRAGWLGSAAAAPVFWAGDQRTSFQADDGLPTVIPLGLGLGLAGVSTYGHDIAGYQSATNPPSTKELFFRWTSLGALSPVMRTHHGLAARENWWLGADEETIAHYRRWASLHVQLFPYLDAGSAEAESTGVPLFRALPLEFPEFGPGWTIADQYLLGPAILVAPVVVEGATSRTVQLPPGRWLPLEGGPALEGPATATVEAPVTELPAFVRAGTVLPLLPETVQTLLPAEPPVVDLDDVADHRVLWVYPGAGGRFTERDGTTYQLMLDSTAPDAPAEAGVPLGPCAAGASRGCVASDGTLRLAGTGPLAFTGHRLEIEGRARTLDVVVRNSSSER